VPLRKHARAPSDAVSAAVTDVPCPKRPVLDLLALRGPASRQYRRYWTPEEAIGTLRQIYGPAAQYRSAKQEEAVRAVVAGLSPILAVLGTGEGKSLLYQLLSRLPGAGTTVLLVPLVALRQNTLRKYRLLGIKCHKWSSSDSRETLARHGDALVIASLDQAVGAGS
jgi:superfamily II DNA helicase RecQ